MHLDKCIRVGTRIAEQPRIRTLILDVADAFMGIPLLTEERCFNVAALDTEISRDRAPLFPGETKKGAFIA